VEMKNVMTPKFGLVTKVYGYAGLVGRVFQTRNWRTERIKNLWRFHMRDGLQSHFEYINTDIRDEIKRRIDQRDKYSVQMTIVLSAVLAIAFSERGFQKALIAAPLASIYFTVLILYSYRVHGLLAKYLRERIEPQLAQITRSEVKLYWENYYKDNAIPGIRKRFFMSALWVITLFTLLVLYATQWEDEDFQLVLVAVTVIYVVSCAVITFRFWK
jgi:hypothetical protein